MAEQAYWLVRAYYLITFFMAFALLRELYELGQTPRQPDPLWPVFWVRWIPMPTACNMIGLTLLIASIASLLKYHSRLPRIVIFLFMLQAAALLNSFGSFNHGYHIWTWLSLCFMLFPLGARSEVTKSFRSRHWFLTCFLLTQLLVALFYTLSGFFKAYFGFRVRIDMVSSFAYDALAILATGRWTETNEQPLLQRLFMENPWIGRPAHLTVMYVELFALVAFFRPAMHRLFGTLLMLFHLGVWMLLGISFSYQPLTMALLFVWSPIAPRQSLPMRVYLYQLPLFGDLLGLATRLWRGTHGQPAQSRG